MSVNCLSLPCNFPPSSLSLLNPNPKTNLYLTSHSPLNPIKCGLGVSFEDVAAIAQNKVLIAAGVSGAIGQFSKPFTSVLLYGKTFDFRAVIQAGGFPSTHSSAVVATATSLAFERGFSDSIFGMTAVYAALVMYDAQGVRREVGAHAKTINRVLLSRQAKSMEDRDGEDIKESSTMNTRSSRFYEEANGPINERPATPVLLEARLQERLTGNAGKESERSSSYAFLKESVGHTEIEVIAGALLGFLVSLTVHAVM